MKKASLPAYLFALYHNGKQTHAVSGSQHH
jgi:hypothetical protein